MNHPSLNAPRTLSVLPTFVRTTLLTTRSYLVGRGAEWFIDPMRDDVPRDFDIIVDPHHFHDACKPLTGVAVSINSFGGLKIIGPPAIDVIPMDLGEYVKTCTGNIAVSLMPFRVVRW